MGSLFKMALAGGVKGAGEGMMAGAKMQHETELQEQGHSLDLVRDEKLAALRNKYQAAGETRRNKFSVESAKTLVGANQAAAETLATAKTGATSLALTEKRGDEETKFGRSLTTAENLAGSQMDLQDLKNQGSLAVSQASSANRPKWMNQRWNYGKKEGGSVANWAEVTTITDNRFPGSWDLVGGNFVWSGLTEEFKPAPQKIVDRLKMYFRNGFMKEDGTTISGAEITQRFMNDYKYLPAEVFRAGFTATDAYQGE